MGIGHAGPSRGRLHAGCGGDHRSARPGHRQRGGHGHRGEPAAHPLRHRDLRPPDLRDRRRRRPVGGRQPRGGLPGGPSRPGPAGGRLRRQRGHHRRRHRPGAVRRRRDPLPVLRLACHRTRRGRRGPGRAGVGPARRGRRRGPALAGDPAVGDRRTRAPGVGHPRGPRLRHLRRGDRRDQEADGPARRRVVPRALRGGRLLPAGGHGGPGGALRLGGEGRRFQRRPIQPGGVPGRDGPSRLGGGAPRIRAGPVGGHPQGLQRHAAGPPAGSPRAYRRRGRPHRQHGHGAGRQRRVLDRRPRRTPDLLRGARARHGGRRQRHGLARRGHPGGGDVPGVRRLHAARGAAGRAIGSQGRLRLEP